MLSPIFTVFMYFPLKTFINFTVMFVVAFLAYRRLRRFYRNGLIAKRCAIAEWLLVFYIELLFFFSVFGRRSWSYYRYYLEVGWSYRSLLESGDTDMLKQILLNIVLFIPVGVLAAYIMKKHKFIKAICLGLLITVTIECLQLVMRTGNFEFDDMINNVLGVAIGAIPVAGYNYVLSLRSKSTKTGHSENSEEADEIR